ncbi:MAG TPA: M55 family metallopeptidase [Vicinamibacteria bacterium]|nr:M55 family metallopeptidase [Vicinamibacteria bacterium]
MLRSGLVALALVWSAAAPRTLAAPRLNVFISTDMEGVGGVVGEAQVQASGYDYDFSRRIMTAETNAAVAAAFAAGATRVTVIDAHGSGTNLMARDLDRRVILVSGFPMPGGMMQGISSDEDAVVFIGYHAHAGVADAIMGHTYTDGLRRVVLNGHEVGEFGLNAALAGHFGVPVVFMSGDRAAIDEARGLCPAIEGVVVKEGLTRSAARLTHPEEVQKRISDGVGRALARRSGVPPVRLTAPITLEVELATTLQADNAALVPGVERVNGTTVRYRSDSMVDIYRFSMLVDRLTG